MKITKNHNYKVFMTVAAILFAVVSIVPTRAATQIDIPGPPGSGSFGAAVAVLSNGNIVVTDPTFDITAPTLVTDVGAVYLYDGKTGNLIRRITGSCQNDNIGSGGIKVLNDGKFLISSPNWDLISAAGTPARCLGGDKFVSKDVGAVTTVNTNDIFDSVSASNSLIGSIPNDRIGTGGIKILSNGNYIVLSPFWNDTRGAVTFSDGNNPKTGQISETNSLTGSNYNDSIGSVTILANGNYVVNSSSWNDNRGAVTLCSGTNGCAGLVSVSNSLVGSPDDSVSSDGVTALTNGNYVVRSRFWNGQRGAVTFGSGTTGIIGEVSSSNSLIGSTINDFVGSGDGFLNSGITVLNNGGYVIISSNWQAADITRVGAATFGNGMTGVKGVISPSNSLIGSKSGDFYIAGTTALSNGNYVVFLPRWNAPPGTPGGAAVFGNGTTGISGYVSTSNSLTNVSESGGVTALTNGNYVVATPNWADTPGAVTYGAVTLGNGVTGTVGTVSAANSLVGTHDYDRIGYNGVTALPNGNYVVSSSGWNNQRGAVTLCDGKNGCGGTVSEANSLTGGNSLDRVGSGGTVRLTNGNYVVRSQYWNNNRGAVTFVNGANGLLAAVNSSNSLIGTKSGDFVGDLAVLPLPNGNYVVVSRGWNESRGAVTWGNGISGISGEITAANSLIGSTPGDQVGFIGNTYHGVTIFDNGAYSVRSDYWDNGSAADAGAVSLSKINMPLVGVISSDNSVRGTAQFGGFRMSSAYDPNSKQLIVGHPDNHVSIFRYEENQTPFDFDGDGKADISVYRPDNGVWYVQQSSNGFTGAQFGVSTDKLVPADYDGDGKTDLAVYRSGVWYLNRSALGFTSFAFGASDDVPQPADFDGDGRADLAVWRPSNGTWYVYNLATNSFTAVQFGASTDKPVAADYDGDGVADYAVYRPANGTWYVQRSQLGFAGVQFGEAADKPVPADYDGDGRTDIAVYRPSNGVWYLQRSQLGFTGIQFGISTDSPAPADYDGDGKTDLAVFREGVWYIQQSTAGFTGVAFGTSTDKPVPNSFVF